MTRHRIPVEIIRQILIEAYTKGDRLPARSKTAIGGACNLNQLAYNRYASDLLRIGCLKEDRRGNHVTTHKGMIVADKITRLLKLLELIDD